MTETDGPRITVADVRGPVAAALLREYYEDIVERYHRHHDRRPATAAEVERAMADEPSGHLAPPGGLFLVAAGPGGPAGCAGVHLVAPGSAGLTRVFVRPAARRLGVAGRLLTAAEAAAAALGATELRLDTRADLVEARALYARHGYREVPSFHGGPYADHFFVKGLTAATP